MKPLTSLSASLLLAAALPLAAHAQTGPWVDGEILLRSPLPGGGPNSITRIHPETGVAVPLISVQAWGGWSGAMVFDSYRGGVLCNVSLPPDHSSLSRLWFVSQDGTAAALPGFTGSLRALAATGDGRVFFIRHTGASQGPQAVEYFDADNQLHTLRDLDGITPLQLDVEHLIYHPATNALIGSSSDAWAATHCSASGSSLYRVPLSADGQQLAAPVSCSSVSSTLMFGEIMSLDLLPGGNVLATTATGFLGAPHRMLTVDPITLAAASWAQPFQHDINGGFWSERLGRAVIHATSGSAWWEPDGLRSFGAGENSYGTVIPLSLPFTWGGGYSPVEILAEVDTNGPACEGFQVAYGAGLAGNGGFVPSLGVIGCPDIGETFTLAFNGVNGGANGLLMVSLSSGAVPFLGGTYHLGPLVLSVPLAVGGTPGVAGAGSLGLTTSLGDPALIGLDIYLQVAFLDAAALHGAALSNGLRLQGG